jgi:YVTN family beta-propeller protein
MAATCMRFALATGLLVLATMLPACKSSSASGAPPTTGTAALLPTTGTAALPPTTGTAALPPTTSARREVAPDFVQIPFGNSGETLETHLPNLVTNFVVRRSDDAIVTASPWDEGDHSTTVIKDGVAVGSCRALMAWGASAQGFVAANSAHVFATLKIVGDTSNQGRNDMFTPPLGTVWWGFNVYDPDCSVPGGAWPLYKNFVRIGETALAPKGQPSTDTPITGIAASESAIYVSMGSSNKVLVVDAKTLKVTASFAVASPGEVALDAKGNLWVIRNGKDIVQLSSKGKPTGKAISGIASPTALGLTSSNDLLVTAGLDVFRYTIAGAPALVQTWSPITSGYDGTPGPLRWRGKLVGAAGDGKGNVVVVWMHGAHAVYESYSPTGALLWQKMALLADEATAPILNDDKTTVDVYTGLDLFTVRLDAQPPSWTWKGHLIDPVTTRPAQLGGSMMVQNVGGRRLVLQANQYSGAPVELLTHSVGTLLQPRVTYPADTPGTNWYWHLHPNGDLTEVIDRQGFFYFRFKGYDSAGVPMHEKSAAIAPPNPSGDRWGGKDGDAFDRVIYDAGSDTLVVGGHTDRKPRSGMWGEFRVLVAYAGFGAFLGDGNLAHLSEKWRIDLPYTDDLQDRFATGECHPRGLWILGDGLFVQFMESERIMKYDLASGAYVGQYDPKVASWDDVNAGLQGVQLPDGRLFLTILSITQASAVGLLGAWGG